MTRPRLSVIFGGDWGGGLGGVGGLAGGIVLLTFFLNGGEGGILYTYRLYAKMYQGLLREHCQETVHFLPNYFSLVIGKGAFKFKNVFYKNKDFIGYLWKLAQQKVRQHWFIV